MAKGHASLSSSEGEKMKTYLNLGCNKDIKSSSEVLWINIDIIKFSGVDMALDLNKIPYPFEDNSIDYVLMSHVIEHLDKPMDVLNELHRICKPNTIIEILQPHFSSHTSYNTVDHYHHFGCRFTDCMDNFERVYTRLKWRETRAKKLSLLNKIITPIVNIDICFTERFLNFLGCEEFIVKLKVLK